MDKESDGANTTAWLSAIGLLLAGLWGFSLWAFPRLPDRFPVHFDFHGNADRWADGSSPEWFLVPGIATLLAVMMAGVGVAIPRIPVGAINLPNKEKFLKLPRDRQLVVLGKVSVMLYAFTLVPVTVMSIVQVMMYLVALGKVGAFSGVPILVGTGIVLLVMVLWVVHLTRAINRETADVGSDGRR